MPRGWKNKNIPTEGFSPGKMVMFTYLIMVFTIEEGSDKRGHQHIAASPTLPQAVNKILSLECITLFHESIGRKLPVRSKDLFLYDYLPP